MNNISNKQIKHSSLMQREKHENQKEYKNVVLYSVINS